ncbi:MAG: DUF2726 domain-containing protein [Nitrospirae bacterium]|nr:DUF2726 domain-containing protein [Nitrospirota bacterium]
MLNLVLWISVVLVFFIVALLYYAANFKKRLDDKSKFPYVKRDSILTNSERSFYGVLNIVLKDKNVEVFCKVGIKDIVKTVSWDYFYFNRISAKHLDFLVCDKSSVSPILAIELDDSSHDREDRKRSDEIKDRVFKTVGIPLVRFQVKSGYNLGAVREKIEPYLNGKPC